MKWELKEKQHNYLVKMMDKQLEYKKEALNNQRDESLTKYLDSVKAKPSVNKKVLYGSRAWNKSNAK